MIRCFDSDDIQNVNPTVDPVRDLEIIETEMKLADLSLYKKDLIRRIKKMLALKNLNYCRKHKKLLMKMVIYH